METGLRGRVVVLGAGGGIGRHVVSWALRSGLPVTATARDPAKLAVDGFDRDADLEVRRADVRDVDSLEAVVGEHDVVVLAAGPPPGRRSNSLYTAGARATLDAATARGADRVIAVTSAGVRKDDKQLAAWYRAFVRPLIADVYADMDRSEATFRAGAVAWTFVRPVLLTDQPSIGTFRVGDAATPWRGRSIARSDVARSVVDEVGARRWIRGAPTLAYRGAWRLPRPGGAQGCLRPSSRVVVAGS